MSVSLSAAIAQASATAVATAIGSAATIEIYTGTKPASPDTTAAGTLLATVALTGSFTVSGGSLSAADPAAVTPVAGGTAGWFRVATSGGTACLDGTVSATGSGGDMQLSSTALSPAADVDLSSVSFTVPAS